MDDQRLDDQLEPIYNSPVLIQDVAWKTSRERWTIEMGGERGPGRCVLAARHNDDDDDDILPQWRLIQSTGAAEDTDCISETNVLYITINECPVYDKIHSNGEVPVMLDLWEMGSTLSLPLFRGPVRPRVATRNRVLSMGQIELICVFMLNWIAWNRTIITFKLGT